MLNHKDIRRIAGKYLRQNYPADSIIISENHIENPYGWYFVANRNTSDWREQYIGDGGFFVDGRTGEILHLGSRDVALPGLDWWLEAYGMGFRPGVYEVRIQVVLNLDATIAALDRNLSHETIPELPVGFNSLKNRQLRREIYTKRLSALPCILSPLETTSVVELVKDLQSSGCCEYTYALVQKYE